MQTRIMKVRNVLKDDQLSAFFISSLPTIFYLTNFTGFIEPGDAYCLITDKQSYLFTHTIYIHEIQKLKRDFVLCEVSPQKRLSQWLKEIAAQEKLEDIGVEEDNITILLFKQLEKIPHISWIASSLHALRTIKEANEIEYITKACNLTDQAYSFLLAFIKPGVKEIELLYKLKEFAAQNHTDFAYDAVIAFGTNAALPHHMPDQTILKDGDVILLDFGMTSMGYCADMSRTIFTGHVRGDVRAMYQTVLDAENAAVEQIAELQKKQKPIAISAIDTFSRKIITERGYPDYPHALGHGIGIEVHENPVLYSRSEENLEIGDVVAIEPGIYIPNKLGIRIEDDFVITSHGPLQLTKSSRELTII